MPKLELSKSIEATPLNKRTLIPAGEPPATIPYGAVIDHIEQDRDFDKFSFLGQPYRCPHDIFVAATRPLDAGPRPVPAAPAATEESSSGGAKDEAARNETRRGLVWQELDAKVRRAKVPGGWLVLANGDGLAFYPDPEHVWDGTSLS